MRRAPYASMVVNAGSLSSVKFSLNFALNFASASIGSALQPMIAVSSLSN
jgi:hypothetical protein